MTCKNCQTYICTVLPPSMLICRKPCFVCVYDLTDITGHNHPHFLYRLINSYTSISQVCNNRQTIPWYHLNTFPLPSIHAVMAVYTALWHVLTFAIVCMCMRMWESVTAQTTGKSAIKGIVQVHIFICNKHTGLCLLIYCT